MNKKSVLTKELFNCEVSYLKKLFNRSTYPWDMIPNIKSLIKELLDKGIPGYKLLKENVLIGEDVKIYEGVTIIGPAIIGAHSELRPGTFIRENVITGENCVLGNSCEFKNCILLDFVQVPHFSYVGDSILGNHVHMGAGSICSNLKADGKNVVVHSDKDYETGLRKLGAILGDYADVGCQSVLNPGTIVGQRSQIYPLCSVRGVVPDNAIYKGKDEIVNKK